MVMVTSVSPVTPLGEWRRVNAPSLTMSDTLHDYVPAAGTRDTDQLRSLNSTRRETLLATR